MNRLARLGMFSGVLLAATSGCLFVRHNTQIVREKEQRQPVRFESERAQQHFLGGVHELHGHQQAVDVELTAVPFLCWSSHTSTLSENAIYNDQISACDSNGDGLITMHEATMFRAAVAQRIPPIVNPANKPPEPDAIVSVGPPPVQTAQKPPPSLISISSQSTK